MTASDKLFSRERIWDAAVLLIAVAAVYGRTIGFDYQDWDDRTYLLGNSYLAELSLQNLKMLFVRGAIPNESLYIPVSYLLFAVDSLLGFRAWISHLLNVLLHATNTLLVFAVCLRLLRQRAAALFVALIFCVHPLQVESVAWVFARRELLAGGLALVSLLVFVEWTENRRRPFLILSIAAFALAVFSKPNVVLLPVFLALLLPARRKTRLLPALAPHLGLALLAVFLSTGNSNGLGFRAMLFQLAYLPQLAAGWLQRLLLLAPPQSFYLRNELSPNGINVLAVLVLLFLLGAVYVAWRTKRYRCLMFVAWGLLMVAPAGSILIQANRQFYTADRYGYLAIIGFAGIIIETCRAIAPSGPQQRRLAVGAAATLGLILFWQTSEYVAVWRNTETLNRYSLQMNPQNPIAATFLGTAALRADKLDEAARWYRYAVDVDLAHVSAWQNLLFLAQSRGRGDAARLKQRLLTAKYGWDYVLYRNASRLRDAGKSTEALALMMQQRTNDRIKGDFPGFHFRLGQLLQEAGRADEAREAYRRCLVLDPKHAAASYNLGVLALQRGDNDLAEKLLHNVSVLQPEDPDPHVQLAIIHLRRNKFEEAESSLDRARERGAASGLYHALRAETYLGLGKEELARESVKAAMQRGFQLRKGLLDLVRESPVNK